MKKRSKIVKNRSFKMLTFSDILVEIMAAKWILNGEIDANSIIDTFYVTQILTAKKFRNETFVNASIPLCYYFISKNAAISIDVITIPHCRFVTNF